MVTSKIYYDAETRANNRKPETHVNWTCGQGSCTQRWAFIEIIYRR